jgi:hypothetical protein
MEGGEEDAWGGVLCVYLKTIFSNFPFFSSSAIHDSYIFMVCVKASD